MRDNVKGGALTEVTFYILLSVYSPRHGYMIMQFIEEQTEGRLPWFTCFKFIQHFSGADKPKTFLCHFIQPCFLCASAMGILMQSWVWGIFAVPLLVPVFFYQMELLKLKKQAKLKEQ